MAEIVTIPRSEEGHIRPDVPEDVYPSRGKTPCAVESEDGVWLCNRIEGHPLADGFAHRATGRWFYNENLETPIEVIHYG